MKVYCFFLLVLVFGVVRSHARTHEYNASTSLREFRSMLYDEFFLVQQWPAAYCRFKLCPSIPHYFTLHGLWAESGGRPVICPQVTSDRLKLNLHSKLAIGMAKSWPNLLGPNQDNVFWLREYNKHASCIETFYEAQIYFFRKTLKLFWSFNVTPKLFGAGILPGGPYLISNIKGVITHAIGVTPMLHCAKVGNGAFELLEIYLCVDKTTFQLHHCQHPDENCPQGADSWIIFGL